MGKSKKVVKNLVGFTLMAMIAISVLPFSVLADTLDKTPNTSSLDEFTDKVIDMVETYESFEETEEAEIDNNFVSAQSVSNNTENEDFGTMRLIVRSSRRINDCGAVAKAEGYDDMHVFQYATQEDAEEAYEYYESLEDKGRVEFAEIDRIVEVDSVEMSSSQGNESSNQKYNSWGAETMGIEDYKDEIRGNLAKAGKTEADLPKVTVAVVDSGIDTDHEIFHGFYNEKTNPEGRILTNGANFSDDGDADNPEDKRGHGTHVSGTIAELTLSNVKILPVRVLNSEGKGTVSSTCLGMKYAVEQGANIVNMSLGAKGYSEWEEEIVNEAYEKGQALFVVAAGNNGKNANDYAPAGIENCITVAAVDSNLNKAAFSNYGAVIDVAAPGVDILSAKMGTNKGYASRSGTSMACPHVAGIAALIKTNSNNLSVKGLETEIKDYALKIDSEDFNEAYGNGFVYAKTKDFVKIRIDKKSGDYSGSVQVKINATDSSAEIFYTLNGDQVSENSVRYTNPINIGETTNLKVVVYKNINGEHKKVGITYKRTYTIVDSVSKGVLFSGGNSERLLATGTAMYNKATGNKSFAIIPKASDVEKAGKKLFTVFTGRWLNDDGKVVVDNSGKVNWKYVDFENSTDLKLHAEYKNWLSYIWLRIFSR